MTTFTEIPLCTKSSGKVEKVQLILAKGRCLGRTYVLMQISAGNTGWDFAFIFKWKYLQWVPRVVLFYLQSISSLGQKHS